MFPGLSLEIRADGDIVYDGMGGKKYYSHSATYPCPGADYAALMYSVSMGQENTGNKISASHGPGGHDQESGQYLRGGREAALHRAAFVYGFH